MRKSTPGAACRLLGFLSLLAFAQISLPPSASAQTCLVTTPIGPGNDVGTAVAIQPDGKIVLAGYRFSGASDDFAIVRYNPYFTLDASFGTGGIVTTPIGGAQDRAEAMALQPDGKIVVAGHKNSGPGNNDFAVVRYNPDGSLDTSFNPVGAFGGPPNLPGMVVTAITGASDEIEGVALQSDGKIVVAGFGGFSVPGTMNYVVARYNPAGSLDTAGFNTPNGFFMSGVPTDDVANEVAIQPGDGKIVVAGWAYSGVSDDFALARLNANGTPDVGFGNVLINFPPNNQDRAHALLLQPADGKILVAGEVRNGLWATFGAARRNADGSADLSFGAGGMVTTDFTGVHDIPFGMVLQTDSKIVLGGHTNWSGAGTSADFGLLRYSATGSLDLSFDVDGKVTTDVAANNDWIDHLALQPDGRIVGGGYSANGANDDFALVRYRTDGSLDNSCVTANYRSIGVNGGVLYGVGNASITAGTNVVTFGGGANLPAPNAVGAVGMGDVLTLDPGFPNEEVLYILSRNSATQVTTQSGAMTGHTAESYEIRRAFTTLQSWETNRQGDLVAGNRREVGITYKDGPFVPPFAPPTSALIIDDSTTDQNRFLLLTVASGQRHDGTPGTGVVVDGQGVTKFGIQDQDDYTRIDGLELVRFKKVADNGFASVVSIGTSGVYQNLLIHDFLEPTAVGDGIRASQTLGTWSFTVRNSILYDGDRSGIRVDEPSSSATVENCTVYGMVNFGVSVGASGGTVTVRNTISMGNGTASFDSGGGSLIQSNDISSDGTGTLTLRTATDVPTAVPNSVVFANLTPGSENFHLKTSTVNDAVDNAENLSASFCCDIDGGLRVAPWDVGADDLAATTEVELLSLLAFGFDGAVKVQWSTASELDNLGFHLYRSLLEEGPYERITTSAIPGLGSSPVGARYEYRDAGRTNGVTYFYKLEDIDTKGRTELHGPVSAAPTAEDRRDGPSEEEASENASLITYGNPSASSLRVLRRGTRQLVLELVTGGFYAVPQDDGSVRISIPDFIDLSVEGSPSVPVKRTWVEALAGGRVELVSVTARSVEAFTGFTPSPSEIPEIVASRDGTVRAGRRRKVVPERAAAIDERLYPSEAARLLSVGFQGEVKKALLELAPLRFDPATGRLLLARRLEVRLSFPGRDRDEARSRRGKSGGPAVERAVHVRFVTRERGLYAASYEGVFRHRRGFGARALRLSRQGKPVAFHIEPDSRRFGPGSTLFFLSEGAAANPYGREAIYELEVGASGETMEEVEGGPSGGATSFYWKTLAQEENRLYQAALVDAPDVWLWDLLFAPAVKSYPFAVDALASRSGASRLSVWLQGVSDFDADPDHHLRLYVNGGLVHESSWDGKRAREIEVELPDGLLHEGGNHLEIENVGDTEASYSMVMLNRFELRYPRSPIAAYGKLEGAWGESGYAGVPQMGTAAHVLDITRARPQWLSGVELGADGALRFRAEAGRRYLAVSSEAVLRPEIRGVESSGLNSRRNGADYLIIGPEIFLDSARPLLELRKSQGLRVKAVSMEEIASAFGFGEKTPEAIEGFLAYAYHHWQAPSPRYVLLLGDASYDFKDYLRTGVENHVPPVMVKTTYLWTASDPVYGAVNGEDLLPDLAIGRLPAATVSEARTMVEKIVAWETGARTLQGLVVLVADNPDGAGDFERDAEELATGALASRNPRRLFLGQLGAAATRDGILRSFDEGASLVSYMGHGGIHLWASEDIWNATRVDSLAPQGQQPLLLTMNCLNGYFHFPYFNSLAEAMLKGEGKGAIAAFSPSGLSLNGPAHRYHQALLTELFGVGHERLGDAVLAAQESYVETGAFPELLYIYHLLGDPALRLQ